MAEEGGQGLVSIWLATCMEWVHWWVIFLLQIISSTTQPAPQTVMHHQHHNSTLTHTADTSLHGTPPTKAPTPPMQDFHQSLTSSNALQLRSFSRLIAA